MPCPFLAACPLPYWHGTRVFCNFIHTRRNPNLAGCTLTISVTVGYQACSHASLSSSKACSWLKKMTGSFTCKRRRARERSGTIKRGRGRLFKKGRRQSYGGGFFFYLGSGGRELVEVGIYFGFEKRRGFGHS